MALPELIKDFNKIRDYMKEFYVNGFKNREDFSKKSGRTYEYEKNRISNWLGDYMEFNRTAEGKAVFLSIDSRAVQHNPLYRAWKTKSFTDCDISLHFIIFDILHSPEIELSFSKLYSKITKNYLANYNRDIDKFEDNYEIFIKDSLNFDESNVRKKLKEYVDEGLIISRKVGRDVFYRRSPDVELCDDNILDFFSETSPCGVVGSFLLDKKEKHSDYFIFKHHYITDTLDSEILYDLLLGINNKSKIHVIISSTQYPDPAEDIIVPLKIYISVQNGRQYVMAHSTARKGIFPFRIDNIRSVEKPEKCEEYDSYAVTLEQMKNKMWGVTTTNPIGQETEHVEFSVRFEDDEPYIPARMKREKRCGEVKIVDTNTAVFSADVYDARELIPWIRTFIGRINYVRFSNKELEFRFNEDLNKMYEQYYSEGGEI